MLFGQRYKLENDFTTCPELPCEKELRVRAGEKIWARVVYANLLSDYQQNYRTKIYPVAAIFRKVFKNAL